MLGVVFTTLLDLLDERYGVAVTEEVLDRCAFTHGGAYTSMGDYPAEDLVCLVEALHDLHDVPPPETYRELGARLVARSLNTHPAAFQEGGTLTGFLEQLEERLLIELRMLREEAPTPKLQVNRTENGGLELVFAASIWAEHLVPGAVAACAAHYGESVRLEATRSVAASEVRLVITPTDS